MPYVNTNVPELGGYDTGTVLENLGVIFSRQEPWLEATVAQLSELADAILSDAAYDPDTLYSILLSLQGYATEETPGPTHPDSPYLKGMEKSLGVYQRLLLYHFLHRKLGALPSLTESGKRDIPATAKGRIAYMKSALANKAYIRFSKHIPRCREADFHSFVDACEEVAGGLCEYCILPLHTSSDGQLMSFYRLIIKYRLQIVASYRVADGQAGFTTFGLLRAMGETWDVRDLLDTPFLTPHEPSPLSLALLCTARQRAPLGSVLTAAECCAVPLRETGSLPYAEVAPLLWATSAEGETSALPHSVFYLSFHLDFPQTITQEPSPAKDVLAMPGAFLMHLMVEASDNLILGLYPEL